MSCNGKHLLLCTSRLGQCLHRLPDIYFNSVDNVNPKYNPLISSALFGIILFFFFFRFLSHFDRQKAKSLFLNLILNKSEHMHVDF